MVTGLTYTSQTHRDFRRKQRSRHAIYNDRLEVILSLVCIDHFRARPKVLSAGGDNKTRYIVYQTTFGRQKKKKRGSKLYRSQN